MMSEKIARPEYRVILYTELRRLLGLICILPELPYQINVDLEYTWLTPAEARTLAEQLLKAADAAEPPLAREEEAIEALRRC